MNDEQIIEYVKKMLIVNLQQYMDNNPMLITHEVFEIQNENDNTALLAHLKGVKNLIEKAIEIIEKRENYEN